MFQSPWIFLPLTMLFNWRAKFSFQNKSFHGDLSIVAVLGEKDK